MKQKQQLLTMAARKASAQRAAALCSAGSRPHTSWNTPVCSPTGEEMNQPRCLPRAAQLLSQGGSGQAPIQPYSCSCTPGELAVLTTGLSKPSLGIPIIRKQHKEATIGCNGWITVALHARATMVGTGETALWLKSMAPLPENLGSYPGAHTALTIVCNCSFRQSLHTHSAQTHRQANIINIK